MQFKLPLFKQKIYEGTRSARLIDTPKLAKLFNLDESLPFNALIIEAKKAGWTDEQIGLKIDFSAKKMFQWNKLGAWLGIHFKFDPQISFLLGKWTLDPVVGNLVVTTGKQGIVEQTNGVTSTAFTYMAIGTGTNAAAAGNTALQTEITTNGGQRAAATCSNQTTTTTGDTMRFVLTYTFTGSFAVTEEGIFNASSSGTLLARDVFSAINVISGDTLQVTHNIQAT